MGFLKSTLAVVLLISLSACGGGGNAGGQTTTPPPPPPPPPSYSYSVVRNTSVQTTNDGATVQWTLVTVGTDTIQCSAFELSNNSLLTSVEAAPNTGSAHLIFDQTIKSKIQISNKHGNILAVLYPMPYSSNFNLKIGPLPSQEIFFIDSVISINSDRYIQIHSGSDSATLTDFSNGIANTHELTHKGKSIYFSYPGIVIDSMGFIHLSYFVPDYDGAFSGIIYHEWFDGKFWNSEPIAYRTLNWITASHTLYLGIGDDNKCHVMWENFASDSIQTIEYSTQINGQWITELVPKPDLVDGYYTHDFRLVVTNNGIPNIAIGYGLSVLLLIKDGSGWHSETIPCGYVLAQTYMPFELVCAADKIGLFFDRPLLGGAGDSIWYIEKNDNNWSTPEEVVPIRPFNGRGLIPRASISKDGNHPAFLVNQAIDIHTASGFVLYYKIDGVWKSSLPINELIFGGPGPIMDDLWMNFGNDNSFHIFGRTNTNKIIGSSSSFFHATL